MPLYEYQCSKCQKVHEVMQKFSDAPLEKCPECQAPVTKLMSLSSFALKGSGWYTTDYKRAQKSTSSTSTSTESTSSSSTSSAESSTGSSGAPAEKSTKSES